MPKLKIKMAPTKIALYWRPHLDDEVRVWRDNWFGDQFEVLTAKQFETVKWVCMRFSIPLEQADDSD